MQTYISRILLISAVSITLLSGCVVPRNGGKGNRGQRGPGNNNSHVDRRHH